MSVLEKLFGKGPTPQRTEGNPSGNPNNPGAANQNPNNNFQTLQPNTVPKQSEGTAPNGVVPKNEATDESPLAAYKGLWEDAPVDPNKPAENKAIFNVKPEEVFAMAGKSDFMKDMLTKEDVAKVAAGGEEAVAIMMQTMNKVGQKVYGQSAMTTTQIVEKALEKQREQFQEMMPSLVRKYSSGENLMESNPAFKHPAVAPIFESIKDRIAEKHPDATSRELEKMTQEMFTGLGQMFAPKAKESGNGKTNARNEFDFSTFLNE